MEKTFVTNYADAPEIRKFIGRLSNPWLFRLFLLTKLPMAFLAGLRIKHIDTMTCQVSVPYKWLNQNPFKSTYFAVLSMAGEMATGVIALMAIDWIKKPIAILVVNLEADFTKKATDLSTFTFSKGNDFFEAVQKTVTTGEAVTVTAESIGTNNAGEEVARFRVTWSLKVRTQKV